MGNRGSCEFEVVVEMHLGENTSSNLSDRVQLSHNTPSDRPAFWLIKHSKHLSVLEQPILHLPGLSENDSADVFVKEIETAANDVVKESRGKGNRTIKYTVWRGTEFWSAENTFRSVKDGQGRALCLGILRDVKTMCKKNAAKKAISLLLRIEQEEESRPPRQVEEDEEEDEKDEKDKKRSRSRSPSNDDEEDEEEKKKREHRSRSRSRSRSNKDEDDEEDEEKKERRRSRSASPKSSKSK